MLIGGILRGPGPGVGGRGAELQGSGAYESLLNGKLGSKVADSRFLSCRDNLLRLDPLYVFNIVPTFLAGDVYGRKISAKHDA